MALRLENLAASVSSFATSSGSLVEIQARRAPGPLLCGSERAFVVLKCARNGRRGRHSGERIVAREKVRLTNLLSARSTRVAGLASGSFQPLAFEEDLDAEARSLNPRDALKTILDLVKKDEDEDEEEDDSATDGEPAATAAPWMSEEEARTVVSEVVLDGDDLRVVEYPDKQEEEPDDTHPVNSVVDSLLNKISDDGRGFSLTDVGGIWKTGEDAGEAKVPDMSLSGFDVKDGVSPLAQWTSTELTMQHSQLARIATDLRYLQNAFAFFGAVRVAEAALSIFSTSPPDFGKLKELLNALDPFTISWLAHNLRQPVEGIVDVDPLDLEQVITLKSDVWEALHKFFERQWKVMATIAMARTLGIIATDLPGTDFVTSKVKFLWDALMALPVF